MECEGVRCIELRRREQPMAEQNDVLIPGLPFEIALLCIARVPRSSFLFMSGVSRAWRNLVHGTMLSEVRCKLSLAEEWLYLWTKPQNGWRCFDPLLWKWSDLPPMPDDNRIAGHSAFASFDRKIFVIGGYFLNFYNTNRVYIPCRTVSYFDARSYSWHRAADLNIARAECMVGIIDEKLFVFGGKIEGDEHPTVTAEVYDPVMKLWKLVSCLKSPVEMYDSVVMGGKFYAIGGPGNGVVYDAQADKWEDMAHDLHRGWRCKTTVLNEKLYTLDDDFFQYPEVGNEQESEPLIRVYHPGKNYWENVNDMSSEWRLTFMLGYVELVSFCGKLCVVSVETSRSREGGYTAFIYMVILEVKESFEGLRLSVALKDEFRIPMEEVGCFPWAIKQCQTIAL